MDHEGLTNSKVYLTFMGHEGPLCKGLQSSKVYLSCETFMGHEGPLCYASLTNSKVYLSCVAMLLFE